jgi:hypothetical protein
LELSLLLGTAATACLQAVAALYTQAWPLLGPAALLTQAAAAAVGGASWGCAAAADVLLVLLAPLVALYVLAAQAQQLQLRFLAASWRLIRGRQKVGVGRCAAPVAVSAGRQFTRHAANSA